MTRHNGRNRGSSFFHVICFAVVTRRMPVQSERPENYPCRRASAYSFGVMSP